MLSVTGGKLTATLQRVGSDETWNWKVHSWKHRAWTIFEWITQLPAMYSSQYISEAFIAFIIIIIIKFLVRLLHKDRSL